MHAHDFLLFLPGESQQGSETASECEDRTQGAGRGEGGEWLPSQNIHTGCFGSPLTYAMQCMCMACHWHGFSSRGEERKEKNAARFLSFLSLCAFVCV